MGRPAYTARCTNTGAVFVRRTPEALAAASDEALRDRLEWVRSFTNRQDRDVDHEALVVGLGERRDLLNELARRDSARYEREHGAPAWPPPRTHTMPPLSTMPPRRLRRR